MCSSSSCYVTWHFVNVDYCFDSNKGIISCLKAGWWKMKFRNTGAFLNTFCMRCDNLWSRFASCANFSCFIFRLWRLCGHILIASFHTFVLESSCGWSWTGRWVTVLSLVNILFVFNSSVLFAIGSSNFYNVLSLDPGEDWIVQNHLQLKPMNI